MANTKRSYPLYTSTRAPTTFRYQSLEIPEDTIRLVRILPDADRGYLECVLRYTSLTRCQQSSHSPSDMEGYKAVSYEWGHINTITEKIYLSYESDWQVGDTRPKFSDLHSFTVGRNLHDFLRQVRLASSPDPSPWLWVDAISLNQSDTVEKSYQVQRMSKIFEVAEEVLIWLGGRDLAAQYTLRSFCQIVRLAKSLQCEKDVDLLECSFEACVVLSRLSFWNRLWIVQELLMARFATVCCGSVTMRWDEFRNRVLTMYAYSNITLPKATAVHWNSQETGQILEFRNSKMLKICNDSRTRLENNEQASFIKLLMRFGDSRCRYVHDRVYALLGLVQNGDQFRIDYDENVDSLARRVIDMFASKVVSTHTLELRHDEISRINWHLGIHNDEAAWASKKQAQENFKQTQERLNQDSRAGGSHDLNKHP